MITHDTSRRTSSTRPSSVVRVETIPRATPSARSSSVSVSAASFLPTPRLPEMSTLRTHGGSPSAVRARQSRRWLAQYSLIGTRPINLSSAMSTRASLAGSAALQRRAIWRYSGVRSRVATTVDSCSRRAASKLFAAAFRRTARPSCRTVKPRQAACALVAATKGVECKVVENSERARLNGRSSMWSESYWMETSSLWDARK